MTSVSVPYEHLKYPDLMAASFKTYNHIYPLLLQPISMQISCLCISCLFIAVSIIIVKCLINLRLLHV